MENTQQEINKTVKSNNVVLFMKGTKAAPQCGFSNKVSGILNYMGVDFKDINDEWIKILIQNPKLIERPIIVKKHKAIIGRPAENIDNL